MTDDAFIEISATPAINLADLAKALEDHGVSAASPISPDDREVLQIAIRQPPADYLERVQGALDDLLELDQRPLVAESVHGGGFAVRPPAG